ncbi:hypothetical protein BGX27_001971 [Mortierella sp. AM989]|nr:hypothetical protein BGX27_001971 [Mortierella sp. AM989]
MAKISTLSSFSLALLALVFASLIATLSIEASPIPNSALAAAPKAPKLKPKKVPSFTVFAKSGLVGKSRVIAGYGCKNHNLVTIGSVRYKSGPLGNTMFFEGKNCTGKVTHQMDTSTVKSMGGPYKSKSVRVYK